MALKVWRSGWGRLCAQRQRGGRAVKAEGLHGARRLPARLLGCPAASSPCPALCGVRPRDALAASASVFRRWVPSPSEQGVLGRRWGEHVASDSPSPPPRAAPLTPPDGPPAIPARVPVLPVPLPGPVELGPVHGPPGAVPGFAEPSGPDPVALYPGPGAPTLQDTDRLLPEARSQDAGGSAKGPS